MKTLIDELAALIRIMESANRKKVSMCIWSSDIATVKAALTSIKEQSEKLQPSPVPAPRSDPNHVSFSNLSLPHGHDFVG